MARLFFKIEREDGIPPVLMHKTFDGSDRLFVSKEYGGKSLRSRMWKLLARMTGGGYEYIVYRIILDGRDIARAEVMPKIYKFPFMGKNSLHIGPCFTEPEFRGKGLYPYLLTYIMNDIPTASAFYIICSESNTASRRGIQKAGFTFLGTGYKTKLHVYKIDRFAKG